MPTAPVPENEPARIRAGETLLFSRSLADYPANDSPAWAITYALRGKPGDAINFTSEADGGLHVVEVPHTTTALWAAGTYNGVGIVSNGSQSRVVWEGQIEILPNLAAEDADFDGRSQAQRILDQIRAVIESRAGKAVASSSIEGNSFQFKSDEELQKAEAYWTQRVAQENRRNYGCRSQTVYAYFTTPR